MKDMLGREIEVDDYIVWAVRRGNIAVMNKGWVIGFYQDGIKVGLETYRFKRVGGKHEREEYVKPVKLTIGKNIAIMRKANEISVPE